MKRSSYRGDHEGSTLKARSKTAFGRVLNSTLALVLVVGLAPSMSFAGEETVIVRTSDGDLTEQVIEQQVPEETTPATTTAEEPVMKTQEDPETVTAFGISDFTLDGTPQTGNSVTLEVTVSVPENETYAIAFTSSYSPSVTVPAEEELSGGDSGQSKTYSIEFPGGAKYEATEGIKITATKTGNASSSEEKAYNAAIDTRAPMALSAFEVAYGELKDGVYYSTDKDNAMTVTWTVGSIPNDAPAIDASALGTLPEGITWSVGTLDSEQGTQTITATFGTNETTYDTDSTGFAPTVTDVVKNEPISTTGKTFGYKVVRDTAAPTITEVKFDKTPSDASVDNALYYNLPGSGDSLQLSVEATDSGSGIDVSNDASYVQVDGLKDDVKIALGNDGKKDVTLAREQFVNDTALKTGTAKIVVTDKAGNTATYNVVKVSAGVKAEKVVEGSAEPTKVGFTAENAWMEAVTTVGYNSESTATDIHGATYFGEAAGMELTVSAAEAVKTSGVTATSAENNGTANTVDVTADDDVYTVAKAGDGATAVTTVQQVATMTSPHNATVTFTRDFTIDPTEPTATIELSDAAGTQSVGEGGDTYTRNVYNSEKPAKATITISNATTVEDSNVSVKVNNEAVPISTDSSTTGISVEKENGTYTITIENTDDKIWFADSTEFHVSATAENAFGKKPTDAAASNKFIVDTSKPVITLAFTGPVNKVEIDSKIHAFFGKQVEGDTTKDLAGVTVTASDPTMGTYVASPANFVIEKSSNGSSWDAVNVTPEAANVSGKPALKATINLDSLGEGDWQLRAKATDLAGNTEEYTYAGTDANHTGNADEKDATTIESTAVDNLDTEFTVDKTQVHVFDTTASGTIAFTAGEAPDTWNVYADSTTLTFKVADKNFDPNSSTIVINDVTNTSKDVATLQNNAWSAGTGAAWTKGDTSDATYGDVWTATYTLDADGIYTADITANDYAKNASATSDFKVEVDAAKPNVTVQFKDDERVNAANSVDYFSASNAVVATVTVVDRNFDAIDANSTLTITSDTGYSTTNATTGNWTQDTENTHTWIRTITFNDPNPAGTKYGFTGAIKDKAGDGHTIAYTYGMKAGGEDGKGGTVSTLDKQGQDMTANGAFVIDNDLPTVEVNFDKPAESSRPQGADENTDYFKDELVATITVTDANFDAITTDAITVTGSGSTINQGWTQDTSDKSKWTYKLSFPENVSGETYSLKFDAADFVGNKTAYEYGFNKAEANGQGVTSTKDSASTELNRKQFSIDCSYPSVDVVMGGKRVYTNGAISGFNNNEVKVTITDAHFAKPTGDDDLKLTSPSGATFSTDSGWSDAGVRTITLADNAKGESYSFTVTGKDLFGNATTYTFGDKQDASTTQGKKSTKDKDGVDVSASSASFIIDTTAPTLDVAFDATPFKTTGKGVNLERYYNANTASVTATITAYDIHADASNFEVKVYDAADHEVSAGDVEITAFALDSGAADTYVAKVKITRPANDATYTIKVTGEDKFENQIARKDASTHVEAPASGDAYYQSKITFDATAPKISVDWGSTAAVNGKYYQPTRTATVTIDEANFDGSLMQVSTDGNTWTATTAEDWSGTGSSYTYTKAFDKDGSYTFAVKGTDLAGNPIEVNSASFSGAVDNGAPAASQQGSLVEGVYTSKQFVIDSKPPTVSMEASQADPKTVGDVDYYNASNPLRITISVDDEHFDPALNAANNETQIQTTVNVSGQANSNTPSWNGGTYVLEFGEHASTGDASNVKATVYDLAGNKAEIDYKTAIGKGSSFVLDRTAPQIMPGASSTNIPTNDPANNFHNASNGRYFFFSSQTSLKMNLYDALGIASYSLVGGADAYKINSTPANGNTSQAVEVALKDGIEFTDAFTLNVIDNAGNWRNWKINPAEGTISETASSSSLANTPLFNTTALRAMYPEKVIQDTVDPKVSLSGVLGGSYYNDHNHAVRLDIDELNFGYVRSITGGQVVLTTTAVNGGNGNPPAETKYARDMQAENEGAGKYYYVLPFTVDGHYTVSAQVTDPAGHSASAYIGEFTVDTKAPECTITWDNNDARNGMYYRAARTATITVTEHNFQASDFNVETTGSVSGWSGSGDTHTCTVSFATDGRYTLSVSGHDRAGNQMTTITEPEFVIDLTAPTIDFSNVTAQTAYNGEIAPVINYHDEANFDTNGMTWTLTGNKHGGQTFAASQGSSGNDGTVSFNDFPRQVEADDIYTLQAHLTDMAGNEADNSITFSVNRFGSNFIILDEKAFAENKGYLAEPIEIRVQEINVSGALNDEHGVSVTHGLTTENLDRKQAGTPTSEGFYVEAGSDNAGWSSYTYHIGSGNFSDDGNYHVVISSTDTATNLNNSASYYNPDEHAVADAEVSFILDTADPIIDGISVTDGEIADAGAKALSFTVTDNIDIDEVKVVVDGEEQTVEPEMGGLCTVDLPAKAFTARDMQIVATDLAGRTAEASVLGFHWTDNFVELHLPFVAGGVIVVVAAVVGGVFFVRRRNGQ